MISTFEIVMDAKDKENPVYRVHVRIKGLGRIQAIVKAEELMPEHSVAFIIAGHVQLED